MEICPMYHTDFYKVGHVHQYPENTTRIFSNFTPRSSRIEGINEVVFFGLQYYVKEYLQRQWDELFFSNDLRIIKSDYKSFMEETIGLINVDHIEKLWSLGYLPIRIMAVPEGTIVPIGVPLLTIENTHPEFYWLTNYLETSISNVLWKPITNATIALQYRKVFEEFAEKTGATKDFIDFQGHDFSYRGMSSFEDACLSGAAHLLSFKGTDTIPAIKFARRYYGASGLIGFSVPASEHSIQCVHALRGSEPDDAYYISEMLRKYPTGIVFIVCDGFDYWHLLCDILPKFKDQILNRDGKVVIRPDSGDPLSIICGDPYAEDWREQQGSIKILENIFGSSHNSKCYKTLNPKIGLIYGDSITLSLQKDILTRLEQDGFASDNVVLGIGSYTYQYSTRDTFGMAMKATYSELRDENGGIVQRSIYKDPKTSGTHTKKSARGLLFVDKDKKLHQQLSRDQYENLMYSGLMTKVFEDGQIYRIENFNFMREYLATQSKG